MNSAEKNRIQAAYERAGLVASLASRGFYVIGEVWRDRICGLPEPPACPTGAVEIPDPDQARPAKRDCGPATGPGDRLETGTAAHPRR